jgi:hypothetical protein
MVPVLVEAVPIAMAVPPVVLPVASWPLNLFGRLRRTPYCGRPRILQHGCPRIRLVGRPRTLQHDHLRIPHSGRPRTPQHGRPRIRLDGRFMKCIAVHGWSRWREA